MDHLSTHSASCWVPHVGGTPPSLTPPRRGRDASRQRRRSFRMLRGMHPRVCPIPYSGGVALTGTRTGAQRRAPRIVHPMLPRDQASELQRLSRRSIAAPEPNGIATKDGASVVARGATHPTGLLRAFPALASPRYRRFWF